jgi:hypothetical protein
MDEDSIEHSARQSSAPRQGGDPPSVVALGPDAELTNLCAEAGCLILLLRLKTFLRQTYFLTESRCLSFNLYAKEVAEKPITPTKSSSSSTFHSNVPMQGFWTDGDRNNSNSFLDTMIFQYARFCRLRMQLEVDAAPLMTMKGDDSDHDKASSETHQDDVEQEQQQPRWSASKSKSNQKRPRRSTTKA